MKRANLPLFMNFYEKRENSNKELEPVVSSKILQTTQMKISLPFRKCSNFKENE